MAFLRRDVVSSEEDKAIDISRRSTNEVYVAYLFGEMKKEERSAFAGQKRRSWQ